MERKETSGGLPGRGAVVQRSPVTHQYWEKRRHARHPRVRIGLPRSKQQQQQQQYVVIPGCAFAPRRSDLSVGSAF
jgi:hypothetical protein